MMLLGVGIKRVHDVTIKSFINAIRAASDRPAAAQRVLQSQISSDRQQTLASLPRSRRD